MFKSMFDKVSSAAKDINLKSSLESTQKSVGDMVEGAKNNTDSMMEKYWPKVERLLYEGLGGVAENKLKDDKSLASAFEVAYEVMPTPVRLILPRDKFVGFCLERKEPILRKLSSYKAEKIGLLPVTEDNNIALQNTKISSNNNIYQVLLPELIALCIAADGQIEESEIEIATAMIENDDFIEDKEMALKSLSNNIENLIAKREKSNAIFKMKSATIISKIPRVEKPEEKERLNIVIEGMLSSVSEPGLAETKNITDSIKNKVNE